MRRGHGAAAALALASALLAGGSGAEEAAGRRAWWHPSLEFRTVADDNVLLQDGGTHGDVGFWLLPRLELGYRAAAYEVGADLGLDVRRHRRNFGLDETFARVAGFGEVGLLPGLSLRVSDAYVPQAVQLGVPEDQPSNLVQTNRVGLDLRYWRELPAGRELALGLEGARFDSETFAALVPGPGGGPPVIDTGFRADFWQGGGFVELQSPLSRRSAVYLSGRARYRSFDDSPDSDLGEYSLLVGLRSARLRSFELDVAGGGGVLDLRTGDAVARYLGRVDLGYRHRSGLRVRLTAQHRFTADLAGNEFVDTTGRLSLERYFGKRTVSTLAIFASYLEDESQVRTSNLFGGLEVALRRQFGRRLQIGLSYRYWENSGSYAADDFQQSRGMLTLEYRQ